MPTIAPVMPPAGTGGGGPGWIPSRIRRMTVEEYERMVDSGIIPSRNRFHLINGYVVEKMVHNPPHAISFQRSGRELDRVTPPGWHVRPALPVRIPGLDSEPEPDHCMVRGAIDDYLERHPGPADVALIVEVADSSLAEDRDYAANLYGPAGIPVCWIVDVRGRRVEVYTGPRPQGYAATEVFTEGQSVPLMIDGREVGRLAVADILPPRRSQEKPEGDGA
jgi:Uma2 family endonuclease